MIRINEYSGASLKSYSDAVKSIVEKLAKSGETVMWFEVLEQRGTVRNGDVEFQVVIKAGLK